MRSSVLQGAIWAVVLSFPIAGLFALLYRFPVPFAGYLTGITAVPQALVAVVFYGILGGFGVLIAGGALGGVAAHGLGQPHPQRIRMLNLTFAGLVALASVGLMAILDKLIGPW